MNNVQNIPGEVTDDTERPQDNIKETEEKLQKAAEKLIASLEGVKRSARSRSLRNPEKYKQFKKVLEEYIFLAEEIDKSVKNKKSAAVIKTDDFLKKADAKYKKRYEMLLKLVKEWKLQRQALIEHLKCSMNKLDWYWKYSTWIRFISSTTDALGSMARFCFNPDSSVALDAACCVGIFGSVVVVCEVVISKGILEDVSALIKKDQELLEPIVEWFQDEKNDNINTVVRDLFPDGLDEKIAREVADACSEQEQYYKIFCTILVSTAQKTPNNVTNKDFLPNLQLFAKSEFATHWWNGIIERNHPIQLEFPRMPLYTESGMSILSQYIPAQFLDAQKLFSLPVGGRILLDALTIYDSFGDIRRGAKSKHADILRKHQMWYKNQLKAVSDTLYKIRPIQNRRVFKKSI